MKIRNRALASLVVTCLASSPALAGDDYRCKVSRIESQTVSTDVLQSFRKAYVGQEFTVERGTGIMAGTLKNSFATRPVVIDSGSKDNSFKAVTTMRREQGAGRGSSVYVLVVNEYEESLEKSFTFFDGESVYFGACKHF